VNSAEQRPVETAQFRICGPKSEISRGGRFVRIESQILPFWGLGKNSQFTAFDVPGVGTGAGQGTFPNGINSGGAIVGWYVDASNGSHSFLRDREGTIHTV
jgi:hypothetical protein